MNRQIATYLLKMKSSSDQYRRRLAICPQLPLRLWIEPTNRCNLKCIICPNANPPQGARYGDMDIGLYRRIIDEASSFAVDVNLFARGESLLHKNIFDMIRYANERGLRTRIETNATVLDEEKSRGVFESGLNFLSFSVDGYTKESYERIRVNADFEKTIRNITLFLEMKSRLKKRKPFVLIQVIEVPLVRQYAGASAKRDFKRMFRGLPVDGFRFIVPHRFGGIIDREITGNTYAYMNQKGFLRLRYTPCPYPWYGMSVYYDGSVFPCCLNFFENYPIGDANEESLRHIWNGGPMVALRETLGRKGYREVSSCKECDFLYQRSLMGFSLKSARDFFTFLRETLND